jgi:epoxyqueuosine reductase
MTSTLDVHQISSEIRAAGRDLGFDRIGITTAEPSRYRDYFRQWLDDGQSGSMEYLSARFAERVDPGIYLPDAASVICVAVNYFPKTSPDLPADHGRIARYALGEDYHRWMTPRLHVLADRLRAIAPEARTKCCVDTAPVMEKELAARAGIGWMGKNTCVIDEGIGSWLFLGEIITTLKLPADQPAIDRCGSCRRCIDACPTGAITEPYRLDARKCISYLTIEHRSEIAEGLQRQMGDWLYGCDVCQEVCPFNRKAPETEISEFAGRFDGSVNLESVLNWTDADYAESLRHSAMKRVKLPMLKRNAEIVRKNRGEKSFHHGDTEVTEGE